jgi:hypothetical protein
MVYVAAINISGDRYVGDVAGGSAGRGGHAFMDFDEATGFKRSWWQSKNMTQENNLTEAAIKGREYL